MSICSLTFLLIFFPLLIGLYFIIPAKKTLLWRNIYLLLFSIFFYTWGETLRVILLLVLILVTYLLGKMAKGKRNTKQGKWAVALIVIINVSVLFFYKYLVPLFSQIGISHILPTINNTLSLPLGLSFFCFSSISYIVDVYRDKTQCQNSIFHLALYLSIFYKVIQGPIVQYNQFEHYLTERKVTFNKFSDGMVKLIIGLGKKVILATNLGIVASLAFDSNYSTLPVTIAWIGSFSYMLQLYFDFSGYSDMAIGLGRMFGFETPDNFNYPYAATSVTEYWQRWHITLGAWFRDYLYYPLTLGPAIKIRKNLAKKHSKTLGKFVVNLFTLGIIWLATSVWHGSSVNYLIWGLINGGVSLLEIYKKQLKNKKLDKLLGWTYTFFIALMVKTLTNVKTISQAMSYYGAMFGFHGNAFSSNELTIIWQNYALFIIIGTIACFPIFRWINNKIDATDKNWLIVTKEVVVYISLLIIFILSIAFLKKLGDTSFLYQKF